MSGLGWELPDKPSASSGSLFDTPSGVGKSGGGFLGSGAPATVGIVVLQAEQAGTLFCGGSIGKTGNKMCIADGCTIQCHRTDKVKFEEEGEFVFIRTKEKDSVFTQPVLPASKLMPNLVNFLDQTRPVASWEMVFKALQESANYEAGPSDVDSLIQQVDASDKGLIPPVTPHRKRAKLDIESSAWQSGLPHKVAKLEADLGPTEGFIKSNLPHEWAKLVANLEVYEVLVGSNRDLIRDLTEAVKVEFGNMDLDVSKLANLMGKRPDEFGTLTVFDCLRLLLKEGGTSSSAVANAEEGSVNERLASAWEEHLDHRVTELDNKVAALEATLNTKHKLTQDQFRINLHSEIRTSLEPVFALFGALSSAKDKPGDLIAQEVKTLHQRLAEVIAQVMIHKNKLDAHSTSHDVSPGTPTPSLGGFNWGLSGQPPTPTAPTTAIPMTVSGGATTSKDVQKSIATLEDKLRQLEEQLEAQRVDVDCESFVSLPATRAWVKLHAPSTLGYVYFADPHSLLNVGVGLGDVGSNSEGVAFESTSAKSGYHSPMEALVVVSFKMELPVFFGKESLTANMSKVDTRALPAVKTFQQWDCKEAHIGARYRFKDVLKYARSTFRSSLDEHLMGTAQAVAKSMIDDSYNFLAELGVWMNEQYRDLVDMGSTTANAWKLVSHCVRAIFSDLHQARQSGRGPFQDDSSRAARIMWGALQVHRVMREYRAANISAHPRMSHILNLHLQENAVMKSDLELLKKQIVEADKMARQAASGLDALKSTVSALRNKKGVSFSKGTGAGSKAGNTSDTD